MRARLMPVLVLKFAIDGGAGDGAFGGSHDRELHIRISIAGQKQPRARRALLG